MGEEMTVSYVVPTVGRPSLFRTLESCVCYPGDEILVIGTDLPVHVEAELQNDSRVRRIACPRGGDWGHKERNFASPMARGDYLAHIDDDDCYAPGTRTFFEDAMRCTPGRPILFRMQYPNGITLWREPKIQCGNVGTPMFLIPNDVTKFGTWGSFVGGDCQFLETSKWREEEYIWRPQVVALLGHNT